MPPPSLDLTDVDPDIMHYEISVFHNKTGKTENFTAPNNMTEYTYYVQEANSNNLCQELEFSILAVNVVGRGIKSTINVVPQEGTGVYSLHACMYSLSRILYVWCLIF